MTIVDSHVHAIRPGEEDVRRRIDETLRDMDAAEVSRAVLFAYPTHPYCSEEEIRDWADRACAAHRAHPDRLLPALWLNPDLPPVSYTHLTLPTN